MQRTPIDEVIRELENNYAHGDADKLRKLAGRRPALPEWCDVALRAGWTPPSTFNREDYE